MKRLLVVADDFGLTPGVNEGVAAAFREGILTSASVLANSSHLEDSLALARSLPGLKIGVHLTLVGGRPVLQPEHVRSLTVRDGRFCHSWRSFLVAWLGGRVRKEEIRAEWRAQVVRVAESGARLCHLDSHQHLHVLPGLWQIAVDVAREFDVPRIRLPREGGPAPDRVPLSRRMVRAVLSRLSSRRSSEGRARCCDHFFGAAEAGRLDLTALLSILRRIPRGWSEIVTHPGVPDAELIRNYPWGYQWEQELNALRSREARDALSRLGIMLDRS